MVDFGGWDLPVQYSGIALEHHAVRTKAGIFDVSHMGEVTVEGPDAEAYLNYVITNDVTKIEPGQALYTVMCRQDGGIVDDLIVYKRSSSQFFICVNAANKDKDFSWFVEQKGSFQVELRDLSSHYAQIALQGPKAHEVLAKILGPDISHLGFFRFLERPLLGQASIIARTGYTGEDGFEIYLPADHAPTVWNALMKEGAPLGLVPCGLGARDTLRLEACLALYGNDIDDSTNPVEAGLSWVVKFAKPAFNGKEALVRAKELGVKRKLSGLKLRERAIARHGYEVFTADGKVKIGEVTSGTLSPTLDFPIAMAYINTDHASLAEVSVKVRDRFFPAELVKMPFYRRKKDN